MCKIPILQCFFENQQNIGKTMPKNDNFSHFAKHRLIKNRYVATPLLTQNWCFLNLHFIRKTFMFNKNKNLNQEKAKIRKGDSKENRREETNKNEKGLMKKET